MSETAKKQLKLALDPELHARLKAAAEADERSLHSMIVLILRTWAADHAPRGEGGQK